MHDGKTDLPAEDHLFQSGHQPTIALTLKSFETAQLLAAQGLGVTLVPLQYSTSYGSQGLDPYIAAYDHRVSHIVKLLEQVAQQQWDGEPDQVAHHAALGHVHRAAGALCQCGQVDLPPTNFQNTIRCKKPSTPPLL